MSINVKMIRESFEKVKPIADATISQFYQNLWHDYPQSKEIFDGIDMEKQKSALIHSLVYIVDHLDQEEKVIEYLKKLGARHINYDTKNEHYAWVGYSLIKTFAASFGDDWTSELEEQWVAAYNLIAKTMQDGATETLNNQNSNRILNFPSSNLSSEGIELADEIQSKIREKVRHAVRSLIRQEVEIAVEEELKVLLTEDIPVNLRRTAK